MQPFIGIDHDMPAYGRALRGIEARERRQAQARLKPLPERVAEAMQDIAAVRGSCDMEDLALRFPGEALSETVIAAARCLAGRRSATRVA